MTTRQINNRVRLPFPTENSLERWAMEVVQIFGLVELFDIPIGGIILFKGEVIPEGWVEDTALTPPAVGYKYITKDLV